MSAPEHIYLEGCLAHCNIANSIANHFKGKLDLEAFSGSVKAVLGHISKFQYALTNLNDSDGTWAEKKRPVPPVKLYKCADLKKGLKEYTEGILVLQKSYEYFPVFFSVLLLDAKASSLKEVTSDDKSITGDFLIIETIDHSYTDGRSAEFVLYQVVEYYNALINEDSATLDKIIKRLEKTHTVSSDNIYGFNNPNSLVKLSKWQQIKNVFYLMSQKLNDAGGFSISYKTIEENWEKFKAEEKHHEMLCDFDLGPLIKHYVDNKKLNLNSFITALIAKAFYHVNAVDNKHPEQKNITFRMMSEYLSPKLRQELIGNYCSYMPVITDASLPLEEVTTAITANVENFRKKKIDVTMYKFLEFALRKHLAGKKDDPVSFTISFILYRKFMRHPEYLKGTTFVRTIGALNYEPLDLFGAKLNNKIAPTLSISNDNKLFITYYPLIGGDAIIDKVNEALRAVIKEEISKISKA